MTVGVVVAAIPPVPVAVAATMAGALVAALKAPLFAALFTSNLDEFFMIRFAGLHAQVAAALTAQRRAGLNPAAPTDQPRAPVPPQLARPAPRVLRVDQRSRYAPGTPVCSARVTQAPAPA